MINFEADIDMMNNLSDFAQVVTHVSTGNTFNAIFDIEQAAVEMGEATIDATAPQLTDVKYSDLALVKIDDILTFNSRNYIVVEIKPKDDGLIADVILNEDD